MCTVTFIPKGETDFILTSNRDEAISRKTLPPEEYDFEGEKLLFPKDELAGGTWIGLSSKNRLLCLLNGAFQTHIKKENYLMSRGNLVKQLLVSKNAVQDITLFNLLGIEPFTILLIEWTPQLSIYELVWDGKEKHFTPLPLQAQIWSSSTLYTATMKKEREKWFATFLKEKTMEVDAIYNFHKHAGIGNKDIDLQIDRGTLKTMSITQVEKNTNKLLMQYTNLMTGEITSKEFNYLGVNSWQKERKV